MPSVSVIIPTYNRHGFLVEAINSVLGQTFTDYEIIVVDDGSTDSPKAKLEQEGLLRKIHFVSQKNAGLAAARNHGLRLAQGEFVTFLDDDDLYKPDKLEKQIIYFRSNPAAVFVHAWFTKFNDSRADLGVRDTSWFRGNIYPQILGQWSILLGVACIMVRRSVFDDVGTFDESLKTAEDLDMWWRIARGHAFHLVREPLVMIRRHAVSMSSDRTKASSGFRLILEKAFASDPQLSAGQKARFMSNMYAQMALNLLGDGTPDQMRQVRSDAGQALRLWPLQANAATAWLFSFVPAGMRNWLIGIVRRARFQVAETG